MGAFAVYDNGKKIEVTKNKRNLSVRKKGKRDRKWGGQRGVVSVSEVCLCV